MKKLILMIGVFIMGAILTAPSNATAYSITLDEFTGTDAQMTVEITGDGTSSIVFDLQVIYPDFADIRGFFFNVSPTSGLSFSGVDITASRVDPGNVLYAGSPSNNLNGLSSKFDVGVEIGTPGIAIDDIYSTSFTVSAAGNLTLGSIFGARLMSVGDSENSREGSSKLVNPVPEPSTLLLLGSGLLGLGIIRYRCKS